MISLPDFVRFSRTCLRTLIETRGGSYSSLKYNDGMSVGLHSKREASGCTSELKMELQTPLSNGVDVENCIKLRGKTIAGNLK
ncbi:hypothetical protein chiPu_0013290 [Chiloscyllium punctatum]|uniref:Uncharacterized protein n=1 Tax=Chiloscyllium punctatum TaxID=137246 RepID=A0A401SWQ7_CHIPU|nr:hypothetical protein [Chiloscyllium punctatum]